MVFVADELLSEIDNNQAIFDDKKLKVIILDYHVSEANLHSEMLENPIVTSEIRGLENRLLHAWTWGAKNYKGTLTEDYILDLAQLISPEIPRGYRTENKRSMAEQAAVYPRWEKIPGMMDAFFRRGDHIGQVSILNRKKGIFRINGEIPEDTIKKIVSNAYSRGYKLSRV